MLNHAMFHLLEYYRQQHIHIMHRVIHRPEAKFQRISSLIHIRVPRVIPSVSFLSMERFMKDPIHKLSGRFE